MRLRTLVRGSLFYTVGNFLPRIGAFLLLPIYTAAMAPAEFGTFSLMLSIAGVLGIVYRFGLDGALMRLHFDVEERDRPSLYLTLSVVTAAIGLVLSVLLGLIAVPTFSRLFAGTPFWPFAPLTLILTFLLSFQYVPSSWFRARELPGRFLLLTVVSFAGGLVGTVLFVLVLDGGAVGALLGQIGAAGTAAAATIVVLVSLGAAAFRADFLRRALTFGLPLLPHSLSAWVLNVSDRWLIGLLVVGGAAAAQTAIGVYSFGYLLGQVVGLVAFSFNAAWVPFFYQRGAGPQGPRLLREMTTLSIAGLAVLAAGIGLLAPELATALAGDQWGDAIEDAARITPIVAVASVAYGLYFMVVSPVFMERRTAVLPALTIAAGLLNVGLNLVLIPTVGIVGAAWATLAGYAALAGLTTWYARRIYALALDVGKLAAIGTGLVTLLAAGTLLTEPIAGTPVGAVAHVALAAAFAGLMAWLAWGAIGRLRLAVAEDGGAGAGIMAAPKGNP
ncbi:MAG TPA: oligosaccharide flippase family protein [Candidatus Limnocylindria bacterium]|nr:oligosaccharide flippase family protein [Candidatus Limnocylindria bacterium]